MPKNANVICESSLTENMDKGLTVTMYDVLPEHPPVPINSSSPWFTPQKSLQVNHKKIKADSLLALAFSQKMWFTTKKFTSN